MSLYIEVDSVKAVLLADGWHNVVSKSFDLDAYEFHHEDQILLGGGQESKVGVPATGATWKESDNTQVACPLTAVLAVKLS
jgi:hypothetical protein